MSVVWCVQASAFEPKGPKDTFDGTAKDTSPCEVDINEGLVDGRTGVHVEIEVVLKCE